MRANDPHAAQGSRRFRTHRQGHMHIIWDGVPRPVRTVVQPYVKRFAPILPLWVETLRICFQAAPESCPSAIASTLISHEYRQLRVSFHPAYLIQEEYSQELTVIHEFVHGHVAGMWDVFNSLLEATVGEDDPLELWATEEWRRSEESCVTDLEHGIARLLGMKAPTS